MPNLDPNSKEYADWYWSLPPTTRMYAHAPGSPGAQNVADMREKYPNNIPPEAAPTSPPSWAAPGNPYTGPVSPPQPPTNPIAPTPSVPLITGPKDTSPPSTNPLAPGPGPTRPPQNPLNPNTPSPVNPIGRPEDPPRPGTPPSNPIGRPLDPNDPFTPTIPTTPPSLPNSLARVGAPTNNTNSYSSETNPLTYNQGVGAFPATGGIMRPNVDMSLASTGVGGGNTSTSLGGGGGGASIQRPMGQAMGVPTLASASKSVGGGGDGSSKGTTSSDPQNVDWADYYEKKSLAKAAQNNSNPLGAGQTPIPSTSTPQPVSQSAYPPVPESRRRSFDQSEGGGSGWIDDGQYATPGDPNYDEWARLTGAEPGRVVRFGKGLGDEDMARRFVDPSKVIKGDGWYAYADNNETPWQQAQGEAGGLSQAQWNALAIAFVTAGIGSAIDPSMFAGLDGAAAAGTAGEFATLPALTPTTVGSLGPDFYALSGAGAGAGAAAVGGAGAASGAGTGAAAGAGGAGGGLGSLVNNPVTRGLVGPALSSVLGGGGGQRGSSNPLADLITGGTQGYFNNQEMQQYKGDINEFYNRGDYNREYRPGYTSRLNEAFMNPDKLLQDQGYKDMRERASTDLSRSLNARGYNMSGNEMGELTKLRTEMDYKHINDQRSQLMQAANLGDPNSLARAGMGAMGNLAQMRANRNAAGAGLTNQVLGNLFGAGAQAISNWLKNSGGNVDWENPPAEVQQILEEAAQRNGMNVDEFINGFQAEFPEFDIDYGEGFDLGDGSGIDDIDWSFYFGAN